jgi:hypothetical protein
MKMMQNRSSSVVFSSILSRVVGFVLVTTCLFKPSEAQRGTNYALKFQPELDSLDIGLYLRNERLAKLQIMCIFYGGPCDITGRWLKPRMIPGLFGNCPACTPYQKRMLPEWLWIFADKYPLMFRACIAQFLLDQGFSVPREEIPKIQRAMGFNEPSQIINPQRVISASYDDALNTRQLKRQPDLISYFGRTRGGRVHTGTRPFGYRQ